MNVLSKSEHMVIIDMTKFGSNVNGGGAMLGGEEKRVAYGNHLIFIVTYFYITSITSGNR